MAGEARPPQPRELLQQALRSRGQSARPGRLQTLLLPGPCRACISSAGKGAQTPCRGVAVMERRLLADGEEAARQAAPGPRHGARGQDNGRGWAQALRSGGVCASSIWQTRRRLFSQRNLSARGARDMPRMAHCESHPMGEPHHGVPTGTEPLPACELTPLPPQQKEPDGQDAFVAAVASQTVGWCF